MSQKRRWADREAVRLPGPDGYHFGDDHPWGELDQDNLFDQLDTAERELSATQATA